MLFLAPLNHGDYWLLHTNWGLNYENTVELLQTFGLEMF